MKLSLHRTVILALSLCLLYTISGCATYTDLAPGTRLAITTQPMSAVVEQQTDSVPTLTAEPPPSVDYIIGAGDVISISVKGRSEFGIPSGGGSASAGGAGKAGGYRVNGSGSVHLPIAGYVKVEGLTIVQAETRIAEALRPYFNDPWVIVDIADYRSRPLYLYGSFKSSGIVYMDRPLTLLQGIALGGGFDPSANIRGIRLTRNGVIQPVDVYDLLNKGDASQNVWLKAGDALYLPDSRSRQVFVFGRVKKSGPVPMPIEGMSITQAIASAELRDTGINYNRVRIIRSLSTTRGELMVVDFEKILRGETLPLQLMEGDVVYVPKNNFGAWNDVIADILPSLQAFSAILQPYITIRFLMK